MKALIAWTQNSTGMEESWYYIVLDELNAEWFIEEKWHNVKLGHPNEEGSKTYSMVEAKNELPEVYGKAIELLKVRLFDNPPQFQTAVRWIEQISYRS